MNAKNGSIGNDSPGEPIWTMANPEPSRTVSTAARPAISHSRFRRRVFVGIVYSSASSVLAGPHPRSLPLRRSRTRSSRRPQALFVSFLRELRDQVEDRHVHRDDDAADDA